MEVVLKVRRIHSDAQLPFRATPQAAGLDLYAYLEEPVNLESDPVHVPTGVAIELPVGWEAQIRPRSSLSARGIGVSFGTIDSDYRGELLVTMYRFGTHPQTIRHGDRIAQLVISRLADLTVSEVATLSDTERGAGRHGSTGR